MRRVMSFKTFIYGYLGEARNHVISFVHILIYVSLSWVLKQRDQALMIKLLLYNPTRAQFISLFIIG